MRVTVVLADGDEKSYQGADVAVHGGDQVEVRHGLGETGETTYNPEDYESITLHGEG